MPRTGIAPNKGEILAPGPSEFADAQIIIKDRDTKPKYTLGILTHYTHEPYHRYRIPVVELCVETMRTGIRDYELLIFDNGSTPDFKKKLRTFNPDILVLSPNLGKQTAQQKMLELARGAVFCYTDDDIYFYPGWLDAHMLILNTFPDRPMLVSGSPQRTAFQWGMKTNMDFARQVGGMEVGRLISEESERQYARSIGVNEVSKILSTIHLKDYLLEYQGLKVWMHAHHMQFVAWRKWLVGRLPQSCYLIDNAREWDMMMDEQGFLRMTTYERSVLHIGNELGSDIFLPGKDPTK